MPIALTLALMGTVASLWLTAPETTADAPEYARDIVNARTRGLSELAEPGHLAWRPLGYAIAQTMGLPEEVSAAEQVRLTQRRMTRVANVAGTIAAMSLALLTWGLTGALLPTLLAPLLLVTSSTFISYAQAGTSYIPALAALTIGMCIGWRTGSRGSLLLGAASGVLIALSVLFWLPFVLVVPAALLGGLWLGRSHGRTQALAESLVALVVCGVVGFASFGMVAGSIGITTLDGFVDWLRGSSHGVTTGGLTRVLIGLPRSFVYMGNDGREVKRFLLGDSLNPVAAGELVRLGLWWKMLAFYSAGATVLILAFRNPAIRRTLGLLTLAAVPVVGLAVTWMGGDLERYLAMYPFVLPLLAIALQHVWQQRRPLAAAGALGALALVWLLNLWSLGPERSRSVIRHELSRIGCVTDSLDATALIVVPHHGDPMYLFARNHLEEQPRRSGAEVVTFVRPGSPEVAGWQDSMRTRVGARLHSGNRIWVADYVRDSVPPRDMGWVEGVDKRVAWADIRSAWSRYDLRPACGAQMGLLRVLPPGASAAESQPP